MLWLAVAAILAHSVSAIEVQFVSQHPSTTLKVEWLGPNDATVDMGAIEPLKTLALKDVGDVSCLCFQSIASTRSSLASFVHLSICVVLVVLGHELGRHNFYLKKHALSL